MPDQIILCRHAETPEPDPEQWPDDEARPLLKKGIKKFKKAAAGMRNLIIPDRVIASPTARTMQTAQLLEWDAGWPAATADEILDDSHKPREVAEMLQNTDASTIAIVGHGPNLIRLMSYLLTTGPGKMSADFDKGGACLIEITGDVGRGSGQLKWFLPQDALKQYR